jgi:protein involved in polysaccharide export with SLBB domain
VVGSVVRPGAFDYQQGLRLSDYVGMAGGPTNRARMHNVVLKCTRPGKDTVRIIDLSSTFDKPDSPDFNPVLAPGDVVTVPEEFIGGTLGWGDIVRGISSLLIFWHRS